MLKFLISAIVALALGACTPLTSPHPLFELADQTGPAPLAEGVWVGLNHECTREMANTSPLPQGCEGATLRRASDGAWTLSGPGKDHEGRPQTENLRLIIVAAVARARGDAYAPLYIVELDPSQADPHAGPASQRRIYGVIAPIAGAPATEAFFLSIDCEAILREGPIAGITAERDGAGNLTGCTTQSAEAVRQAARRALIEGISNIDQSRLLFVHG